MILRLVAVIALVSCFSGGAWYALRDTPQKRILRWREDVERYLFAEPTDIQRAEELNEKILELSTGAYDVVMRGRINELKGTRGGLEEAIAAYDEVLSRQGRNLRVAFLRSRACAALGRREEAQGTLLSVADTYPFDAMMALGETANGFLQPDDGIRYYFKSLALASSPEEEARAHEGLAQAYALLIKLNASVERRRVLDAQGEVAAPDAVLGGRSIADSARETRLFELQQSRRLHLERALQYVKTDQLPSSNDDGNRRLAWAASIYRSLAEFAAKDETPYWDGVILIKGKLEDYAAVLTDISSRLNIALGALQLRAVWSGEVARRDAAREAKFVSEAEGRFVEALEYTPEEARSLLASVAALAVAQGETPQDSIAGDSSQDGAKLEDGLTYLQTLISVCRVYLSGPDASRLLVDGPEESQLALARRVKDAIESGLGDAALACIALSGMAHLKDSEVEQADLAFARYLEGLPPEERPKAVLDLAEQVALHMPESPFVFRYLEEFSARGGDPLDLLSRRLALLLSARAEPALAEEATRRLEETLRVAGAGARTTADRIALAKVLYSVEDREAAIRSVRAAVASDPDNINLKQLLAVLLRERADALGALADDRKATVDKRDLAQAYRDALAEYLELFVRSPGSNRELIRAVVEIVREAHDRKLELDISTDLAALFPEAKPASVETFSSGLTAFLLGKYSAALGRLDLIEPSEPFEPFYSFVEGVSHLGLADFHQQSTAKERSPAALAHESGKKEHQEEAVRAFRGRLDFDINRFELASVEFATIPEGVDVPDALLERIAGLRDSVGLDHRADYLHAQALLRRFKHRYRSATVKNSELVRILSRAQKLLRRTIVRKPTFGPAYLLLAETFLISERADREVASVSGVGRQRVMFSPDYARAIAAVRAVPKPDELVVERLAAYLEASGRPQDARRYLEELVQLQPTAETFERLFMNYLRTRDLAAAFLLGRHDAGRFDARRRETLEGVRKSFETLREVGALRHSFAALLYVAEAAGAVGQAKERLRASIVKEYTTAMEIYHGLGIDPPTLLLNNLAWYLAESGDPAERAQGVLVALRATGRVPEPKVLPTVYDTYGWALYRDGQLVAAETCFRQLLTSVEMPTYRYHLARVLYDLREYDDALAEVRIALDSTAPFSQRGAARELESDIRQARRASVGS